MSAPDFSNILADSNCYIKQLENSRIGLSKALVYLLVKARSEYEWPYGTGPAASQRIIFDHEKDIAHLLNGLTPAGAKKIIEMVSRWGGNNQRAIDIIANAESKVQILMANTITDLADRKLLEGTLDTLSSMPGLRLVMASKVYRFCCPEKGAAVDRHSSYFFNSLLIRDKQKRVKQTTKFKREWSNGKHTSSRLAIYQRQSQAINIKMYLYSYLPLLERISKILNENGISYHCKATDMQRFWRPCDVEMAAYLWWAQNGPR